MKPSNLLFIFSDQHARGVTGCYGHPVVKTPHMDALAKRGTLFTNAYTPGPICVPARASLATGRYVHDIGYWDNCSPYTGTPDSWGHRLQAQGNPVLSIGKLHYRDASDDVGFDEERLPMHVIGGVGMLFTIVRDPMPSGKKFPMMVEEAGPGESTYTQYDRDITTEAVRWLEQEAAQHKDKPWALFVSLVCPHPPFLAPEPFYSMYDPAKLPFPLAYGPEERPTHPAYEDLRKFFAIEQPFDEATVRKVNAAYFGLTSYLDDNIGKLLAALERSGFADNTRVVYTSDHGESMGQKGLFSKCNFMEESVGIPMIVAGPEVPENQVVDTPVSLVDCFPTVLEAVGVQPTAADKDLPGVSLFQVAKGVTPQRAVLSEQHSAGAKHGGFMIRQGRYKYVHYVNYEPILYDLAKDPHELHNVAADPAYAQAVKDCEAALRAMLNPEEVDAKAKAEQKRRLDEGGGQQAVVAKGSPGYTPAPGEEPVYVA